MKKLIIPAVLTLLALTLAVTSVFAWFVVQKETNIGPTDIPISGMDVTSVSVEYYFASSTDGNTYTLGALCEEMPVFSPVGNTPVIAEIQFGIKSASDFAIDMTISCTCPNFVTVTNSNGAAEIGNAYLSNISQFAFMDKNGANLTINGNKISFFESGESKKTVLNRQLSFVRNQTDTYTIYFMIDYNQTAINQLYFMMLQQGIVSNGTQYSFPSDLLIGLIKGNGAQ